MKTNQPSTMSIRSIIIPVALLAALAANEFIPSSPIRLAPLVGDWSSVYAKSRELADRMERNKRFRGVQETQAELTRRNILEILANARNQADTRAWADTAPFMGTGNVIEGVKMSAMDWTFKSTRFQDYTQRAVAPTVQMLADTQAKVDAEIAVLANAHQAIANDFRLETLALGKPTAGDESALPLPEFQMLGGVIDANKNLVNIAAVSSVIEVAFVTTTIHSVLKVTGHLVARQAGTLTAAGGCAVADGPLPFGDMIAAVLAIGGTVWTACDINSAVQSLAQLPGDFKSAILNNLEATEIQAMKRIQVIDSAGARYISSAPAP